MILLLGCLVLILTIVGLILVVRLRHHRCLQRMALFVLFGAFLCLFVLFILFIYFVFLLPENGS